MADIQGLVDKYKQIPGERFFADVFEKEEYKPARDITADVVLDVGACAGEFSAYIYDKAQVIYALEPEFNQYQELTDNIAEFDLVKMKPYRLALGGENGQRYLAIASRGGHMFGSDKDEFTQTVETKTLATFMRDEHIDHIDLLKIDVENAEDEIFNAKDFPEVADKISYIIGEHLDNVRSKLIDLGFSKTEYERNAIYTR